MGKREKTDLERRSRFLMSPALSQHWRLALALFQTFYDWPKLLVAMERASEEEQRLRSRVREIQTTAFGLFTP